MDRMDRNDIAHYFDEEATYLVLPEYKNSYIFYNKDFLMCNYDLEGTEERALLSKLLTMIKENCICNQTKGYYIINEDKLLELFDEFSDMEDEIELD